MQLHAQKFDASRVPSRTYPSITGLTDEVAATLTVQLLNPTTLVIVGEGRFRLAVARVSFAMDLIHRDTVAGFIEEDKHLQLCAELARWRKRDNGTWYRFNVGHITPCTRLETVQPNGEPVLWEAPEVGEDTELGEFFAAVATARYEVIPSVAKPS